MIPIVVLAFSEGMRTYFAGRLRREDLRPILVVAVLYWILYSLLTMTAKHVLLDAHWLDAFTPSQVLTYLARYSIAILWMVFTAFMQVAQGGIPAGITREAALMPGVFAFAVHLATIRFLALNTSLTYAIMHLLTVVSLTLAGSFLLRSLRARSASTV